MANVYYPPQSPQIQRGQPGTITDPVMVVVLSLVTCGGYYFYWYYKIRTELKEYTGDESINPTLDLILGIVTCTLWFVYIDYITSKLIAQLQTERGIYPNDVSTIAILIDLLTGLGFISSAIEQKELNRLWEACGVTK